MIKIILHTNNHTSANVYEGNKYMEFKSLLGEFLSTIPDQPSVSGMQTDNLDGSTKSSMDIYRVETMD